jgi:hypothetical protein
LTITLTKYLKAPLAVQKAFDKQTAFLLGIFGTLLCGPKI